MTLPYANAISGEKALIEIQKILRQFNCDKFGTMIDWDAGTVLVQFQWQGRQVSFPASFKGYAQAWLKENPWNNRKQSSLSEWQNKSLEIGSVAVYSILRDWIKAQVVAVETGLLTSDEVFMPHMLLPNGQRFIEYATEKKLLSVKDK